MKMNTTWSLKSLGKSVNDTAFKKERNNMLKSSKRFSKKWNANKKYLVDPKIMKEALDDYELMCAFEPKESLYLMLSSALDSADTKLQAAINLYSNFANEVDDLTRFFGLEISKIPKEKQKKFLDAKVLSPYYNFLKESFSSAKYLLSEKEEKIISMKSSVASGNWVDMLEEFLSSETAKVPVYKNNKIIEKKVALAELLNLISEKNEKVSKSAATALHKIYAKHAKLAEKEINSFLANKKINDELRGFKNPQSARIHAESLDEKTVETLTQTVTDNFSISREYYTFKAKILGKKKLQYSERAKKYSTSTINYTYQKSIEIVSAGLSKISSEFADIFDSFTKENCIDVYPKKGKYSGAFCMPAYKGKIHLMLNHTDSLRDVTTLAHEVGHGIHGIKARSENSLNYGHPMCTAEVSSTFCEDFVLDELKLNANKKEELVIIMGQLDDKISTIFRQIAAYNFEKELHLEFRKNGYLKEGEIGIIFNKHMKSYMGNAVIFDENSSRGWMGWSHFRNPFYVFAYSMALLVAQFARKKFDANPNYIEKINQFYSTGSSVPPATIFKRLGLNIHDKKSWQQGIDQVETLLKTAKKLARKLKKI